MLIDVVIQAVIKKKYNLMKESSKSTVDIVIYMERDFYYACKDEFYNISNRNFMDSDTIHGYPCFAVQSNSIKHGAFEVFGSVR